MTHLFTSKNSNPKYMEKDSPLVFNHDLFSSTIYNWKYVTWIEDTILL